MYNNYDVLNNIPQNPFLMNVIFPMVIVFAIVLFTIIFAMVAIHKYWLGN